MCNAKNHPPSCNCGFGPTEAQAEMIEKINDAIVNTKEIMKNEMDKHASWVGKMLKLVRVGEALSRAVLPDNLSRSMAGDVILVGPDGWISERIRDVDKLMRGTKAPASHVLTVLRVRKNGQRLYLDHTWEGSRIISESEMTKLYGHRKKYLSRPLGLVNGRALLQAGLAEAQKPKSDWGVLGKNTVCTDKAGFLITAATGLPIFTRKTEYIKITPSDFWDKRRIGKYFAVTELK